MLITQSYIDQLKQMHNQPEKKLGFGTQPPGKLVEILKNSQSLSVLDFGCGKGEILSQVQKLFPKKQIMGYDPGVEVFSHYPLGIDFIYSVDVLEHVEPEFIDEVLRKLVNEGEHQYHLIACCPAKKNLPDGRNCHLIIEQPNWWIKKFNKIIAGRADVLYTNSFDIITKRGRINTYCEIEIKRKL